MTGSSPDPPDPSVHDPAPPMAVNAGGTAVLESTPEARGLRAAGAAGGRALRRAAPPSPTPRPSTCRFMVLLGSLFVVSGGILVTGDIEAKPVVNATFLAVGAVLASLIGTTGASVLLIRPLLSTNEQRRHVAHTVVFFIFMVSNTGGCLTPLGDARSSATRVRTPWTSGTAALAARQRPPPRDLPVQPRARQRPAPLVGPGGVPAPAGERQAKRGPPPVGRRQRGLPHARTGRSSCWRPQPPPWPRPRRPCGRRTASRSTRSSRWPRSSPASS